MILGALAGDTAGSVYEFDNIKTEHFPLLTKHCYFTDDSVMTLAVAQALLDVFAPGTSAGVAPTAGEGEGAATTPTLDAGAGVAPTSGAGVAPTSGANTDIPDAGAPSPFPPSFFANATDDPKLRDALITSMRTLGRRYPSAGYGGRFVSWLSSPNPQPYNSWGNGSAMRVSPVAWICDTLDEVDALAAASAQVTHNHVEGIRGAQATAACILLARQGADNDTIRALVRERYGYALDFTLDEIRPTYDFDVSCQGSVPQAIEAFLESNGFEDSIRKAISIGGDSDTIAAITASIAQGRYGVPRAIENKLRNLMTPDLLAVNDLFCATFPVK